MQKYDLISRILTCIQKVCKKQKFTQKYDFISRILTCIQKVCKKKRNSHILKQSINGCSQFSNMVNYSASLHRLIKIVANFVVTARKPEMFHGK